MPPFGRPWFLKHQALLKWLANTKYGKGVLGHNLDGVDLILPNAVFKRHGGQIVGEFRTHDKYAKRLFYEYNAIWKTFHWFDMNVANIYVPKFNLGFDTTGDLFPAAGNNSPIDGYVERAGVDEIFSTIRAGAGTATNTTGTDEVSCWLQSSTTSSQYQSIRRGIYLYDTSGIGAGATVDAAVISFVSNAKANSLGSPDFHVVASTPAANDALANSDYGQTGTTSFGNITYASWDAGGSTYNDITMDANGEGNIDVSGISKFGSRTSWDQSGTFGGSWSSNTFSRFNSYYADETGTSKDPKLVVTFTPASGAAIMNLTSKTW